MQFLHMTATSISEIQKCAEVGPDKRYAFFLNPLNLFWLLIMLLLVLLL